MSCSCFKSDSNSLEAFFRRQAIRWAGAGFVLTLALAIPCILYSAKIASERQLLATVKATVRAFRPQILQGDIRNAEFQMRKALELRSEESAIVYDSNLQPIYPIREQDQTLVCPTAQSYCWDKGFRSVSILYPIFFDDQKEEGLFGYLGLKLKPNFDIQLLSVFVVLLLIAFITQAFGLSSALNHSATRIVSQLSHWAEHLKKTPHERLQERTHVPYKELHSMQAAVDGLYLEIEKLTEKAAKQAKTEAHEVILREIGHDLRTPHSLLAKYFALCIDSVRTTGRLNEEEVSKVEHTLKRMGDLLRQVRTFSIGRDRYPVSTNDASDTCHLGTETSLILDGFQHDPELIQKGSKIELICNTKHLEIHISRTAYYRILENLIRNAIDAIPSDTGKITIRLHDVDHRPAVSVIDNGIGIPHELQETIFDCDFTTKPSRGTGLGLGIVRKVCQEYNAIIQLTSDVGKGTTFTVIFQKATPPQTRLQEVTHVTA